MRKRLNFNGLWITAPSPRRPFCPGGPVFEKQNLENELLTPLPEVDEFISTLAYVGHVGLVYVGFRVWLERIGVVLVTVGVTFAGCGLLFIGIDRYRMLPAFRGCGFGWIGFGRSVFFLEFAHPRSRIA